MTTNAVRAQVAAKWQESFVRMNRGEPGITGLLSLSDAWEEAAAFLHPQDINISPPRTSLDMERARPAFTILSQARLLPMILENFLEDVRKQQHLITKDIQTYMYGAVKPTEDIYPEGGLRGASAAIGLQESSHADGSQSTSAESDSEGVLPASIAWLVYRLVTWYERWRPPPDLGSTIHSAYMITFQTHVFSALPSNFAIGLKRLIRMTLAPPPPEDRANLPPQIFDQTIWTHFDSLGLIDRYETLIASVCYEHIEEHVQSTCTGLWTESMLGKLREWMANTVVPWMILPYARGAKTPEEARSMLQGIGSRFDFHVCKTLCDMRTEEIFDIIVDYPDSQGALVDLCECLQRVDQRTELVRSLRLANKKRLLHPGADTKVILQQYVSMIRCLRQIDPPGVLLYKVADPIRRYLRDRPDTIRSIVASLVADDELGESLIDESEPIQPLQAPQAEDYGDPNWEPEPIDAGPDFRTNKPSDIVSTLVSIYDSKDLFVKELQVLLAQRLLTVMDGNFDRERRYIEILKIRFGEAALQVCEVMLRDMTDSKRTDQHIQSHKPTCLHPTVISEHFWPTLKHSKVTLPGQMKEIQDAYAKEFSLFKPDKRLKWLPLLGNVSVELELQDRTISASVSPLAAAFIELFSEKPTWSVADLNARIGLADQSASLKELAAWVDLGVLREDEEDAQFTILEVAEAEGDRKGKSTAVRTAEAVEEPEAVSALQQQQAEQMKIYWKFIDGMLKNLGSLPLDRIQMMLKLAPGYDRTTDQLATFMDAARREGLVIVSDGKWKLNKT